MRLVILFGYSPNRQHGKTVYEQGAAIEGHLAQQREAG